MAIDQPNNYLLIGTPAKVIVGGPIMMRNCKNIFEGITVAQQRSFEKIFLVYSEIPEPKLQALEALHQVSPEAMICLLIQMAEEPDVHEWMRMCSWAKGKLDYLICPLNSNALIMGDTRGYGNVAAMMDADQDKDRRIIQLERMVVQDDLTGLKNRRYLRQFLPAILDKASVSHNQITLLLFDIDDFKRYNDTYGHSVGDAVLKQTSTLMRRCCRDQDVVARLGGDEFAVVFWDVADGQVNNSDRRSSSQNHPREAVFMSERFRKEISDTPFNQLGTQGSGYLTISGGLATFPTDASNARELFEKADQAMLEAKRSGKNRIYLVGEPN